MQKTRTFIQQNPKWQMLEVYIPRIESYSDANFGFVIENCKALMEAIFKTILAEVEQKTEDELKKYEISRLTTEVRKTLKLKEGGYSQIIGSFSSAIANLRNDYGETSHAQDIRTLRNNRHALFPDEVNFLRNLTDDVAFFFLSYYKNLYPAFAEMEEKILYEEYAEFNDWFDKNELPASVKGAESPSKSLFENNNKAYRVYLLRYQEKDNLIIQLSKSHNFDYTRQIIAKLSELQEFSPSQIRRIREAFVQNNQVYWIANNRYVESFCKPLIFNNRNLFNDDEFNEFTSYYSNTVP